jgi:hypothetical protein
MDDNPLPLYIVARRLGVPANWLRAEAEAGRVPHLKAGRRVLLNLDVVCNLLAERAKREGLASKELTEGATKGQASKGVANVC